MGWLVAVYDDLVGQEAGAVRDAELEQVQRWLYKATGLPSLSGAVAAARRLTRHAISSVAPVSLPSPKAVAHARQEAVRLHKEAEEAARIRRKQARRQRRKPGTVRTPLAGRQRVPRPQPGASGVVPALDDQAAAELDSLLGRLDALPRRSRIAREEQQAESLRQRIQDLTGFTQVDGARAALRNYLVRRDGARRFIPTKPYAEGPARTPPPIQVVRGGSPGGGRRA
uniref:hypothetical protein n=1 Tax=Actinokineospora sp. CA-119265 TaxID=3239890 RepID=UPI003F49059A